MPLMVLAAMLVAYLAFGQEYSITGTFVLGCFVAYTLTEVFFTGTPGKYVPLAETIRGFKMIVAGECDHLPEQAFYMVGTIDEAFEKAKKLAA